MRVPQVWVRLLLSHPYLVGADDQFQAVGLEEALGHVRPERQPHATLARHTLR